MGKVKRKRLDICSSSQLKECSSGGHPAEDGEDRISSLPDGILSLILSFLTFKEMVQTSLLSRRWLYLWMDSQVLHFDYLAKNGRPRSHKKCRSFVSMVNGVLKLHKSQRLKEFRITFLFHNRYQKDISRWLEYALARKVESLELSFLLETRSRCYLWETYDFAEFLNLNSEKAVNLANPDKCLDFRSLKSLSLKSVKVTDKAIDFILRNCPLLERLKVDLSWELHNLVISGPEVALKYLHIHRCQQLELVSISNINLVYLNIALYRGTRGFRLTNLPVFVELSIEAFGARDELRNVFSQSSCCLSQLESLTITASELQHVTQLSELARLTKLKQLVLNVEPWPYERLVELVSFIQACPNLEEFVLMLKRFKSMVYRTVAHVETCSLKCLKVFKFGGYDGFDEDLELVMHILENSASLEKIIIDPRNPCFYSNRIVEEEESRSIAMQQFEGFRGSTQPCIIIM